jgi:hypothetical protein
MNAASQIHGSALALQLATLRRSANGEHRAGAARNPNHAAGTVRPDEAPPGAAAHRKAESTSRPHAPTASFAPGGTTSAALLELMIHRMGGAAHSSAKGTFIDLRV